MNTDRVARRLRPQDAPRYLQGTCVSAPASGRVPVDVGGQVRSARVPSSIRGLASGMDVRISVQGNTVMVDAITSNIAVPSVSSASSASVSMSTNWTASSGAYDYSIGVDDWGAVKNYTRDIAATTRGIAGDLNAVRSVVNANAVEVDTLTAAVNGLRAQVAALTTACRTAGIIT